MLSYIIASLPSFSFGVSAVAVFFILSGYAMTGLLSTRFATSRTPTIFYLERVLRIALQYYFWLIVSCLMSFVLGWMPTDHSGFIPYGLISYLTIVPLGLQGTLPSVQTLLIPQAGSLGVEIICYLFSPWMLKSTALSWLAAIVSLAVFAASNLGRLPEALYTYYSAPGPLVLYIIGGFIYRKDWKSTIAATVITLAILAQNFWAHYNVEFIFGITVGLPTILVLIRLPSSRWDSALGNASYGCFLGHGCVNWTLMTWYKYIPFYTTLVPFLGVSLSCLAGYFSYRYVEQPTVHLRKSLRSS